MAILVGYPNFYSC